MRLTNSGATYIRTTTSMGNGKTKDNESRFIRLRKRIIALWAYCTNDVWNDTRHSWKVNLVKTLNLSVRSFLNGDLQSKACALTYRTILSVVPALALICAIGRGFGLQRTIETQLIEHLPSQAQALETAFSFVDSYLSQASGGLFVGVGVIFLLWTLISLLQSVESVFNDIWLVPKGRSIWRMTTDYLAIFLILPILLICASGISLFMSTSLSKLLPYSFMQPAIEFVFDAASVILSWLFFAGTYMLIPNTRVRFRNAIIPGILVGSACQILQWLFVSGQMYVAKYNAIYGSFSFLPLFLIWMQLVWLFTLIGAVLCYSIQNIGEFNYGENIKRISPDYLRKATLSIYTIIARRFYFNKPSMSLSEISQYYKLPINLVTPVVSRLKEAGLVNYVEMPDKDLDEHPVQPSTDVSRITVADVVRCIQHFGDSNFLPGFDKHYITVINIDNQIEKIALKEAENIKIVDLDIKL